jgi:hypothetical protein
VEPIAAGYLKISFGGDFSEGCDETHEMDGCIVSGEVALLRAGHKTGPMCTTVYISITYFVFDLRSRTKQFCVACIWLR